ncbi:MAG TPA: glycoside hydrolase family 130 protein [Bryobacteraceae bacterium]
MTTVAVCVAAVLALAQTTANPFSQWIRLTKSPILTARGSGFESAGTFNPAVIRQNNRIVMLYRAQDRNGVSRLGYATSADGIQFTRDAKPVFTPETPYESAGVEDPRLVEINDSYYLTYTGYNRVDAQLCLAKSADLRHWSRLGVILPANRGRWNVHWTKSGAILPQKVNGHYWMYFMGDAAGSNGANQMGVAYSDDLIHWAEPLDHPLLPHRKGMFDSKVVEPGPPPVMTSRGILLIYNGGDDRLVYRTGWALFDKSNPAHVLARSNAPVFRPTRDWEINGQVPNVVFVEGLIQEPRRWLLYYGAGDKNVGVISTHLEWK